MVMTVTNQVGKEGKMAKEEKTAEKEQTPEVPEIDEGVKHIIEKVVDEVEEHDQDLALLKKFVRQFLHVANNKKKIEEEKK